MIRSHETELLVSNIGTDATSPDDEHLVHLNQKDTHFSKILFSIERMLEHPKSNKMKLAVGAIATGAALVGTSKLLKI